MRSTLHPIANGLSTLIFDYRYDSLTTTFTLQEQKSVGHARTHRHRSPRSEADFLSEAMRTGKEKLVTAY